MEHRYLSFNNLDPFGRSPAVRMVLLMLEAFAAGSLDVRADVGDETPISTSHRRMSSAVHYKGGHSAMVKQAL